MARSTKKEPGSNEKVSKTKPSMTDAGRLNECIALAYDLVEERLRDGTATSQETVHFLKLATDKTKLERERLELENQLIQAKTKAYGSDDELKKIYQDAINAMSLYSGTDGDDEDD